MIGVLSVMEGISLGERLESGLVAAVVDWLAGCRAAGGSGRS